jgi:hypothetical protein
MVTRGDRRQFRSIFGFDPAPTTRGARDDDAGCLIVHRTLERLTLRTRRYKLRHKRLVDRYTHDRLESLRGRRLRRYRKKEKELRLRAGRADRAMIDATRVAIDFGYI